MRSKNRTVALAWHPTVTAIAAAAALAGLVAVARPAAAAGPEPQSCSDCCKLPCIEAQIWDARYRRGSYKNLAKQKNISKEKYEARENEFSQIADFMKSMHIGQNPSCQGYVPADQIDAKRLALESGFVTRWDGSTAVGVNVTLITDPETCQLTKAGSAEWIPKMLACSGMGDATVAHEQKHMDDCNARKKAKKGAITPAENATDEVNGYQVELDKLEQLAHDAAQKCSKESCKKSQPAFDRTARLLNTDINKILDKVKKKAPSNSPLARAKKGS